MNQHYITCKRVLFYSLTDEDLFFEWIKKIACIEKFEAAHDELYLDLQSDPLSTSDIQELFVFCYRYNIDLKQLLPFLNEQNKEVFKQWKKRIKDY